MTLKYYFCRLPWSSLIGRIYFALRYWRDALAVFRKSCRTCRAWYPTKPHRATMNPGADALFPSCRHSLCPHQCQADIVCSASPTICSVLTFECAMTPCLEHLLPGWCCRLRSSDTLLRSYWWRWVTGDRVFGSDLHLNLSLFFSSFIFCFLIATAM